MPGFPKFWRSVSPTGPPWSYPRWALVEEPCLHHDRLSQSCNPPFLLQLIDQLLPDDKQIFTSCFSLSASHLVCIKTELIHTLSQWLNISTTPLIWLMQKTYERRVIFAVYLYFRHPFTCGVFQFTRNDFYSHRNLLKNLLIAVIAIGWNV